jgi:2-polyprenyl-6-hydroxyphenyl methylase/3-demethylubiquinone-9 3-methyltransferase
MSDTSTSVDPAEIAKFDALASRWWDLAGEFAPLHQLNPLRLGYLLQQTTIKGARVLDVGCGGGILTESLAREGADALGVDLAAAALDVARLHALDQGVRVAYQRIDVAALASSHAGQFDVVTCMEMLEHVPDPAQIINALALLVRPGGDIVVSTINRNLKSFLVAIIGAEYLTRTVPRGTHDYARFIRPSELARAARSAGLIVRDITGVHIDPLTRRFSLSRSVDVNYLMHLSRPRTNIR